MSDFEFRTHLPKMGVDLVLTADGQHFHLDNPEDDVRFTWDNDSIVLTIYLDEWTWKDLYWELLELIPKLRKDRP